MARTLEHHWPEYSMEAAGLAVFMVSICSLVTLMEHPSSPARLVIENEIARRALTGAGIGLTATAIIYSPWGRRSGAHINPAVTLTFFRLGKIDPWDAASYVVAQFWGAVVGVVCSAVVLGEALGAPPINYAVTTPGELGPAPAFLAEVTISFGLMITVLVTNNHRRWSRATGVLAGALIAAYVMVEQPLSGMSMNPARSFASGVVARHWSGLWVYFTAPLLGMLLAAETYVRLRGVASIACAKLQHDNGPCVFRCRHGRDDARGTGHARLNRAT